MSASSATGDTTSDQRGRRLDLPLSSLYLDPNNYRFIDHDDYQRVDDASLLNEEIQRRTSRLILGKNAEQVADLVASFTQNGWLDVEPIHVRGLADHKYLVVEGNRRVATLKHLRSLWRDSTGRLDNLDPAVFQAVPCIRYEATDEVQQLVVMGLHHISGKRRWPAINQARLMKRLRDEFKLDPNVICRSLGVSRREFNLSLRTLALSEAYRGSDYEDQFSSDMFNLFREVIKAPSLRTWLRWDHNTERAHSAPNLERLFSWLSREPDSDSEDDSSDAASFLQEPVIRTGGQIRELAKIIEDPDAVKRLEETRSLQAATLSSDLLVKNEIQSALERCSRDVSRLFQLAVRMSSHELDRVDELTSRMEAIATARKRQPPTRSSERAWQVYTDVPQSHFGSIDVHTYRAIGGLNLEHLGRVNLLVGVNNAGKTSVLEAVYLLASQADPRAALEVLRRRSRISPEAYPSWTVNQLPDNARMSGTYDARADNAVTLQFMMQDDPEDSDEDWAKYLRTLVIESSYVGRTQRSVTDFFDGRTRRTRIDGEPRWLCRALLHSPFSLSDPSTLTRCNEASIRARSKERVLDFIRSHLDAGIQDIALADEHDRFLVTHADLEQAVDLSFFGEGLQRIFQIGLLFAGTRGGVVLIDEFENALHTSVLIEFTKFVQKLAVDFDVQVFITTHSKETVDAFLLNDFRTDDIVAYLLKREEGEICPPLRFSGPELKRAVEVGDVDLRRL